MTEVSEAKQELHLIRHLAVCIDASNYLDKRAYLLRHIDRLSETLTAAIAAIAASPVRVKALEWMPSTDGSHHARALGLVYHAANTGKWGCTAVLAINDGGASMDDAKAAAQADYEARILSALEDGQ